MDYYEAMSYISSTYKFGYKLGLERIRKLMELLDNPHKKLKFVHIAGTNGKGSTTAYISNILTNAGYKTGVFISPYIQRFSERIKIDNHEISDEDIVKYIKIIKEKIGIMDLEGISLPTEFEILTAMALLYYYDNNCDVVVLETGLGGIIDSTNVIEDSLVSVIVTISYDHTQYLGNTLTEIAEKKAGIIKQNGSVAIYPQTDEVMAVFEKECVNKQASLYKLKNEDVKIISENIGFTEFDYNEHRNLKIKLLGSHQAYNAALSVKAIEILVEKGYTITEDNIKQGLLNTKWPGRFEIVHKNPIVIIDGAHNLQGANSLASGLRAYFENKKFIFVVGILKDKDYEAMLAPFIPMAKQFVAIAPDSERAKPAEELKDYLLSQNAAAISCDGIKSAMDYVMKNADKDDIICAFGSLYYIGSVRDYFGLV